jgi:hypothetical protein
LPADLSPPEQHQMRTNYDESKINKSQQVFPLWMASEGVPSSPGGTNKSAAQGAVLEGWL